MRFINRFIERYIDKKKFVTDLIRIILVSSAILLWQKWDTILNFLNQLFNDWIIRFLSIKISLPISLLVLLITLLLAAPLLISLFFIKSTSLIIKEWIASTNKATAQWTSWKEVGLKNEIIKSIKLNLKIRSSYMRFGFKFLDKKATIMGPSGVLNNDNNILIHIGKQIDKDEIGFVSYKNGVKDLTDISVCKFDENKDLKLKIKFLDKNNLQFYINRKVIYTAYIDFSLRSRVCLMAWGDRNEYNLIAEDIKIVTHKPRSA